MRVGSGEGVQRKELLKSEGFVFRILEFGVHVMKTSWVNKEKSRKGKDVIMTEKMM
jgi:hypothetical protein